MINPFQMRRAPRPSATDVILAALAEIKERQVRIETRLCKVADHLGIVFKTGTTHQKR